MSLSILPPELKLSIVELLEPDTGFNFAISCKEYWQLSESIIKEHKSNFLKYQAFGDGGEFQDVFALLKTVLRDKRKGYYIQELDLNNYSFHRDLSIPSDDDGLIRQARKKLLARYSQIEYRHKDIDRNKIWCPSTREEGEDITTLLNKGLTENDARAFMVILIHYLPFVKTLRITNDPEGNTFHEALRWLAFLYAHNMHKGLDLPLSRLHTISMSYYDTESCTKATWAVLFSYLPSLRVLAAFAMGNDFRYELCSQINAPPSNITELYFCYCQFETRALRRILGRTPNLERFTYLSGGATVDYAPYDHRGVIDALVTYTSRSLQYLILHNDYYPEGDDEIGYDLSETAMKKVTLRDFKRLKLVKCDWFMLRPEDEVFTDEALEEGYYNSEESGDFDIRHILPESLEQFYMEGTFDYNEWAYLKRDLDAREEQLPNLRRICITPDRLLYGMESFYGSAETISDDLFDRNRLFAGHGP